MKKKINAFDYNCKNGKYFYDSDFQESFSSETEEITDKEELLNEKILKRLVVEELNPMKQLESFVREDLKVKEFFKNNNIKPKHSGLFSLIDLEKSLK